MFTPALALAALGGLALSGNGAVSPVASAGSVTVQVAAIQVEDTMSDACVWSPEAAAAGAIDQCGSSKNIVSVFETARTANRALVWPDDFIAMTVDAASEAWDATVGFLSDIYQYAFESEEPPKKAGS